MKVAILQPSYLPWLGFFYLMYQVDLFIYHCDVQYDKSWRNRNRIRTQRETSWLTVPVLTKGKSKKLLLEIEIDNSKEWARRHWNLIYQNYHTAPYFGNYASFFEDLYLRKKWGHLVDLNYYIVENLLKFLNFRVNITYSTKLYLGDTKKNERIIRICQQVGADTWLANSTCRNYVVEDMYKEAGINVIYHDYKHPEYKQLYEPFISHLSIIDLLFCHGDRSLDILTNHCHRDTNQKISKCLQK